MTGFFSKTLFFLLTMMIIPSFSKDIRAEMTKKSVKLPKTIGFWTRSDNARIIDSGNIFDYMNGAGELYLAYGFDHLEVYEYTSDRQDRIMAEVYVMYTSNDAFGLLSLDWGGEPVTIHSTPPFQSEPCVELPVRALYGGGLLRIWSDNFYARVMAYRETVESKKAVLSLGQAIAAERKRPAEPELLKVLPTTVGPDWKLRKDRIGYFRSHLVLNSLYYLSHQNILHLDHSTEAVTAPYEKRTQDGATKYVQVLFVKYALPAQAGKALADFHKAYLPEHQKGFDLGITTRQTHFFKIEDGWLGYALDGAGLAIVFECPNRESAQLIIKHITDYTVSREKNHGK